MEIIEFINKIRSGEIQDGLLPQKFYDDLYVHIEKKIIFKNYYTHHEDIIHETITKFIRNLYTFRGENEASLNAYLKKTLLTVVKKYSSKKNKFNEDTDDLFIEKNNDTISDNRINDAFINEALNDCIEKLPSKTIDLTYIMKQIMQGLKQNEIAQSLKIDKMKVNRSIPIAYQYLKSCLENKGFNKEIVTEK
ncbi:MAG TPA: sigma-70 family RNA polymerase sigma factor [Spirochaetota bacterium]|nr:sigma-70 family RNA polymerase sigma factor [Spirochaetota bacterium]HRX49226.1 sigma-70 family RNA polymerase sigma factor [Spirochaetota bacterium]